MVSSVSLDTLPEDLRVVIISKIASDSIKELHNLKCVSRTFQKLCNEPYVLRSVNILGCPFFVTMRDMSIESERKLKKFQERCFEVGNPVAIYRVGYVQFFSEENPEEGLQRVAFAAREGVVAAQYFYGIILVCLGGEGKEMGFGMLARLRKHLVDPTDECLNELHPYFYTLHLRWEAKGMVKRLKDSYVRDRCNCGCVREPLRDKAGRLERCIRLMDSRKFISLAGCEICLSHHVLQLFFDVTEELPESDV